MCETKGVQAILDTEGSIVLGIISQSSISNKAVDNTVNEAAGQESKTNACADKKKGSVHCNR